MLALLLMKYFLYTLITILVSHLINFFFIVNSSFQHISICIFCYAHF